jgi:hypothetical protein
MLSPCGPGVVSEYHAPQAAAKQQTTRRRVLLVRPGYDPSLDGDGKEGVVDKSYYDADSIEPVLRWFENRYEISSEEFYEAHVADTPLPDGLEGFHRHCWASFYREAKDLTGRSFAERAERVLAGAA